MNDRCCYVTIATRGYLASVAVLAQSLSEAEPGAQLIVYLVERDAQNVPQLPGDSQLVAIGDMQLPERERLTFQYDAMSLCCAMKPRVVADAFERFEVDLVIYLDADLAIYAGVQDLVTKHLVDASVLLTPHVLKSDQIPNAAAIARSGSYNAGFFAVKNDSFGNGFLLWWSARTRRDCILEPANGVLHDQRWLDLAVALFPCIHALRHPGVNVGHWNLHEKRFAERDGQVYVDDDHLLKVFHFSGLEDDKVSRYMESDEREIVGIDLVRRLAADYRRALRSYDKRYPANTDYSFGTFVSGNDITHLMRETVRIDLIDVMNPFDEETAVTDSARNNELRIRQGRVSGLIESASECHSLLKRLYDHPLIGPVWRFTLRFINRKLWLTGG